MIKIPENNHSQMILIYKIWLYDSFLCGVRKKICTAALNKTFQRETWHAQIYYIKECFIDSNKFVWITCIINACLFTLSLSTVRRLPRKNHNIGVLYLQSLTRYLAVRRETTQFHWYVMLINFLDMKRNCFLRFYFSISNKYKIS